MIGPRCGVVGGPMGGARVGVGTDELASQGISGVTRDVTSQIYTPASSTEWSNFISGAGLSISAPSFLWLCQEASGDLADSIGGVTLTHAGTPTYQQAMSGWSRKFVTLTEAATMSFSSTSASLPDISTTSFLMLIIGAITGTPATTRNFVTFGTTQDLMGFDTSPHLVVKSSTNTATGTTVNGTTVGPWALRENRTGGSTTGVSGSEKLVPTHSTSTTGKKLTLGPASGTLNAPPFAYGYAVGWSGAAAEMTDAQLKALLQAMGFVIGWS